MASPSFPLRIVWVGLTFLGSAFVLTFAGGCGHSGQPAVVLQATPEAVVLIQDNEARCARIGQDGARRLAKAEAQEERNARLQGYSYRDPSGQRVEAKPPVDPIEDFKSYLKKDAAEELAAVEAAHDAIKELLPKVKTEAPRAMATAIAALAMAQEQVCLTMRQPALSAQYQGNLDASVNLYSDAAQTLMPLFTPSETDTQFALHKYSSRLDDARAAARARNQQAAAPTQDYESEQREWQAAQELQAQQQAEHETALNNWQRKRDEPQDTLQKVSVTMRPRQELSPEQKAQAMMDWHAGYKAKVAPVKAALSNYLRLKAAGSADLAVPCQTMLDAGTALLADRTALEAPDAQAAKTLRRSFTELQALAEACHNGQTAEATFRFDAFERTLGQAAAALGPYSLAP
jgi:hypothetical protein